MRVGRVGKRRGGEVDVGVGVGVGIGVGRVGIGGGVGRGDRVLILVVVCGGGVAENLIVWRVAFVVEVLADAVVVVLVLVAVVASLVTVLLVVVAKECVVECCVALLLVRWVVIVAIELARCVANFGVLCVDVVVGGGGGGGGKLVVREYIFGRGWRADGPGAAAQRACLVTRSLALS
jgi:hypothetical protein